MDKIVERFNIFDTFTMLIPGIGITSLFYISLSFEYDFLWLNMGNEKYLFYLIFSYFCGIIYQEFGTICDRKFLYEILYKGNPREIVFLKNGHQTILNEDLFFNNALILRDYIIKKFNIQISRNMTDNEEKELNSIIFGYCLNMAEDNNLAWKSEKMSVLSEMSRSLFWGCISTIILNFYMLLIYQFYYKFYFIEILLLIFASYIFFKRKERYERYRIRILLRTLLLNINTEN